MKILICVQSAFRILQPTAWCQAGGTARLQSLVFDAVHIHQYCGRTGFVHLWGGGVERDVNKFLRKVWYPSARIQDIKAVTSNSLWYSCSTHRRLHPAGHATSANLCLGLLSFHNISIHSFNVLLTVHLSITLVNDQLDAQFFYFIIRLLQSSTCFERRRAHLQEVKLY